MTLNAHFTRRFAGYSRKSLRPGHVRATDVGGGRCPPRANVIGAARSRQIAAMSRGDMLLAAAGGAW